ncbi:hypothetical protein [Streptomyces sp. NPDC046909]|uniref:hypothetical protein n=1 Tax=Streptomyces sp. NPDC046909 TaxID=3155617 RepID=UPI0033CFEA00
MDARLWVEEAERERAAIVAELSRDEVGPGVAAAVHAARPNLTLPDGALVATAAPDLYAGLGVGIMALSC